MQSIFRFKPIYKERPWGGRRIAQVSSHHQLPENQMIGESWEISDRPGDESVITNGEFAGKNIRWLLENHGTRIMGRKWGKDERFPLLIKVLDAEERLSLQVHPPKRVSAELKGEPKTEMWYLLDASDDAAILAGLKKNVTRDDFEKALKTNQLEPLIHRIPVKKGDAVFIPSGRIHAIDAGCLILEIQQNSDTTYRVYDWGRVGLDGKPREMHIEQSLKSTDFNDFEPEIYRYQATSDGEEQMVACEYFITNRYRSSEPMTIAGLPNVLHVLKGSVVISSLDGAQVKAEKGETLLLGSDEHRIRPDGEAVWICSFCKCFQD